LTVAQRPKSGQRGDLHKPEGRVALETPHAKAHTVSVERRMGKGIMPKALPGLLRWYAEGWDSEVPTAIHKSEVWRDHGPQAQGGSKLGTPAHSDPFRRYLENMPSEMDADGYYTRPMHAALSRLGRRHPLTARALFAVAQSGYDWRGVAERGHWADEMFEVYIAEALRMLWREYADEGLRLQ
jgi:hypothetical protein